MRLSRSARRLADPKTESTTEMLRRTLRHPDAAQFSVRLEEVAENRAYLQHGVEVNEGDVVLDAGASVGIAAAFFAAECRAGVVHSFEPLGPIFEILRLNLRHFPACVPHNYALSNTSGTGAITYYPNVTEMSGMHADPATDRANLRMALLNLGGSEREVDAALRDRFAAEVLPCELRTVSQVLREESIDRVDLLKLDVEKSELEVLAGVDDADWPIIRQISGELHLGEEERAALARLLSERGFEVAVTQDPSLRGTPVRMFYAVRG